MKAEMHSNHLNFYIKMYSQVKETQEKQKVCQKKFKQREKNSTELKQIQERSQRFKRHDCQFEQSSIQPEIMERLNSDYLDRFLRTYPHSEKVKIPSEKAEGFIYKIVYKNGDQIKGNPGMGIKIRYKTYLVDGTLINSSFKEMHDLQLVGRKYFPSIYEIIAQNTSCGEIGTFIFSAQNAYGEEGNFPQIPPKATIKVNYWIVEMRMKDPWQYHERELEKEIELVIALISPEIEILRPGKLSEQKLNYYLYRVRFVEDVLSANIYSSLGRFRKKLCFFEIVLTYLLKKKLQALQLMDKYFQLEGRSGHDFYLLRKDLELEKILYPLKIQLQQEFGFFEEIKTDIKKIESLGQSYLEAFKVKIQEWRNLVEQFEKLSVEDQKSSFEIAQKNKKSVKEFQLKSYQESYIYNPKGYKPNENKLQKLQLSNKTKPDGIFEWALGLQLYQQHLKKLESGWLQKEQWEKQMQYKKQLKQHQKQQAQRKEQCQRRNYPFEPGCWVHKKEQQTWNQYYARRRQIQFEEKFYDVKRQYGEKEENYKQRMAKAKQQSEVGEEEEGMLQKLLRKKMKKGFKNKDIPSMPKEKAYKCFDLQ